MNVGKVPPLFGTNIQLYLCFAGTLDWTRVVTMAKGGGLPPTPQPATEMPFFFYSDTHIVAQKPHGRP